MTEDSVATSASPTSGPADPRTPAGGGGTGSSSGESGRDWSWVQPTVTIGSLVLAVLMPPVGLVGSIISLVWANRTGTSRTMPIIGIVVGALMIILFFAVVAMALVVFREAVHDGAFDLSALCAKRDSWGPFLDLAGYVCK